MFVSVAGDGTDEPLGKGKGDSRKLLDEVPRLPFGVAAQLSSPLSKYPRQQRRNTTHFHRACFLRRCRVTPFLGISMFAGADRT